MEELRSMRDVVMLLYKIESGLNSKEVDMGPNGSYNPCSREVKDLKKVKDFLERTYCC